MNSIVITKGGVLLCEDDEECGDKDKNEHWVIHAADESLNTN